MHFTAKNYTRKENAPTDIKAVDKLRYVNNNDPESQPKI